MVKTDGVQRGLIGPIIQRFEQRGFKLVALKMIAASGGDLEKHYEQHKEKAFFSRFIKYMASGPVVGMVWEGVDAVLTGRVMLGMSNPLGSAAGTIRGDYALTRERSVCHASDTVENAEREVKLWFPEGVVSYVDCKVEWIYAA